MCGRLSHAPHWGPGPQPRHVPWLQPATPWSAGLCSIHWAPPARAVCLVFIGTVFQSGHVPIRVHGSSSCTTSSATVAIAPWPFSHSERQGAGLIMVLTCISLISNCLEALFHVIIDHLDLFFMKCLFTVFCPLLFKKIGIFVFFLQISVLILDMSLLDTDIVIFSPVL